jgi:hypothetical protein
MRRTVADTGAGRIIEGDMPPAVAARRRSAVARRRRESVAMGSRPVVTPGPRTGRPQVRRPARSAGGAVAGGAGSALLLLARLVRFATGVVAAIIVAAILLWVLGADPDNAVVSAVDDLGRSLVGPFDGLLHLQDANAELALNWGLATVAWAIAGGLVAGVLARAGLAGASRARS